MKNNINKFITYTNSVECILSFVPLIKFWKRQAEENKVVKASYEYIRNKLDNAPELFENITDFSILEKHKELIEELLSICLPPGIYNESYAAVIPDRLVSFFETPAFKRLHLFENQMKSDCFNENCCLTPDGRFISSYAWMLGHYYRLNVSYEYPLIYTSCDESTGIERYYRVRIFSWFCRLKTKNPLKELTEDEKRIIFENLDNPKVLAGIVPPENFILEGFYVFNATEITDHESISAMKFDLIGKESLMSMRKFENLQHKLRVLLRRPNISLGLIAFPDHSKSMSDAIKMGNSMILNEKYVSKEIVPECKLYLDVIESKQIRMIYDIKDFGCSINVETAFINAGIRNLLIAPLIYKDQLIGIMEVASPNPGDLNKLSILKLKEVYPLFAICIESCLDNLNKSVQSVIKEKCTAIHPSVEWRFRDAAVRYLDKLRNDIVEEMEDIVFDNVNPFYGCSDIKDSSVFRNSAIQTDLIENLEAVKKIISEASKQATVPILDELSFRISNQIGILKEGLSSTSEIEVINFVRNEIVSTLDFIKDISPEMNALVTNYKKNLHPELGFLFKRRKEFEESLGLVNETISMELEIQQDKAQKIFPHYFEKYKTDGVEYNMYAGESMACNMKFNPMHFKSLRLWQLVTMCIIAKKCNELLPRLSVPLRTTHLIYVSGSPITIRFLYDEKKFDIAGSYDVRYEIIKKRIDKAAVKGTGERIVSPGKIAVIYSRESEAEEYRQYFNFLKTKNYISDEVETFELEDMQGVRGLKALRISVNNDFENETHLTEKIFEGKVS